MGKRDSIYTSINLSLHPIYITSQFFLKYKLRYTEKLMGCKYNFSMGKGGIRVSVETIYYVILKKLLTLKKKINSVSLFL